MARIRSIKPEFWSSEQINECSLNARLMFIGIWNFADDAGRKVASTKRLKMEVFPGDAIRDCDIRKWMNELIANGLVLEYEAQGQRYWQVTGWKHQKIQHPQPSAIPDPFSEQSMTVSVPLTPEGNGREGNREKESTKKECRRFQAPSVAEVKSYAESVGYAMDAQAFVDYFESVGWTIGKGKPMRDWKAAVRTWRRRDPSAAETRIASQEDLEGWTPT